MRSINVLSTSVTKKETSTGKVNVFYWIFTGLLVSLMSIGSIPDMLYDPEAVALFNHLGYPVFLLPFLGVAKLLGVIAILAPGFHRLKEWAYVGFTYDLCGAFYSGIAVGDPVGSWAPILIGFVIIAGSYVFYHKHKAA